MQGQEDVEGGREGGGRCSPSSVCTKQLHMRLNVGPMASSSEVIVVMADQRLRFAREQGGPGHRGQALQ